jgi:hypothetical protein
MSCALTHREEAALRSAASLDVACSEADGGKVFHLTTDLARRTSGHHDLADWARSMIEVGVVMPGFVLPNRFCPRIVMRASPNIRQLLGRAKALEDKS